MELTKEQLDILNGSQGEIKQKVLETIVRYGELFGATKLVAVTSEYNHLVTSFGLKGLKSVYELLDRIIDADVASSQKFTVDPRPLDKNVPSNFLKNFVFNKFMYTRQESYEKQLDKLGLLDKDAFTCTCYHKEVGNTPKKGDILSWSESSAVVYANSVLGARCNRNSGIIDIMGSIVGFVPYFGFLTDEGRKASYVVKIETTKKPEAQLLGSAIGMKVVEEVPYVIGLDKFLGDELNDDVKSYLKDFGAATASNGSVGLYHIDNLTPEAKELGKELIKENAKEYIITDEELERVYKEYPIIWKNKDAKPKICFIGCPHLSMKQLETWADNILSALDANKKKKVVVDTVLTTAPAVLKEFKKDQRYQKLVEAGVVVSYICPLMYMNNPLCEKTPTITSSNKLRTYTSSRYYKDNEILNIITGGNK